MEALTLGEVIRLAPNLGGFGVMLFVVWAILNGHLVPGYVYKALQTRNQALEARQEKMLDVAQNAMSLAKTATGNPETPIPPSGGAR